MINATVVQLSLDLMLISLETMIVPSSSEYPAFYGNRTHHFVT